ncbi:interleukin-17A [Sigmodon hispidus]
MVGLILNPAKEEEGEGEGEGSSGGEKTQIFRHPEVLQSNVQPLDSTRICHSMLFLVPLFLLFTPLNLPPGCCLLCSRNEDPDRYPSVIWEAQCRHQRCVNAEGKLDHHMNSVLIQQEILVLRREPGNCPLSFRMEKMLVGVGCTCVSAIVRHVG